MLSHIQRAAIVPFPGFYSCSDVLYAFQPSLEIKIKLPPGLETKWQAKKCVCECNSPSGVSPFTPVSSVILLLGALLVPYVLASPTQHKGTCSQEIHIINKPARFQRAKIWIKASRMWTIQFSVQRVHRDALRCDSNKKEQLSRGCAFHPFKHFG